MPKLSSFSAFLSTEIVKLFSCNFSTRNILIPLTFLLLLLFSCSDAAFYPRYHTHGICGPHKLIWKSLTRVVIVVPWLRWRPSQHSTIYSHFLVLSVYSHYRHVLGPSMQSGSKQRTRRGEGGHTERKVVEYFVGKQKQYHSPSISTNTIPQSPSPPPPNCRLNHFATPSAFTFRHHCRSMYIWNTLVTPFFTHASLGYMANTQSEELMRRKH